MPTYDYQCDQCHRTFEVRQRITAPPLTRCEACGGSLRRLLSPAPFILKGEGWYVTDYPSEARKKALQSEKATGKSDEKATGKGDEKATGKSDEKATGKSDEKSTTSAEKSSTSASKETPTTSGSAAPSASTPTSSD